MATGVTSVPCVNRRNKPLGHIDLGRLERIKGKSHGQCQMVNDCGIYLVRGHLVPEALINTLWFLYGINSTFILLKYQSATYYFAGSRRNAVATFFNFYLFFLIDLTDPSDEFNDIFPSITFMPFCNFQRTSNFKPTHGFLCVDLFSFLN